MVDEQYRSLPPKGKETRDSDNRGNEGGGGGGWGLKKNISQKRQGLSNLVWASAVLGSKIQASREESSVSWVGNLGNPGARSFEGIWLGPAWRSSTSWPAS